MSTHGLSAPELAILEAALERLIPSDASGPGAREAQVVRYVIRRLAGPYRHHLGAYRRGLGRLGADALTGHGADFPRLAPRAQDELLQATEARTDDPFFELVLAHAMEGMFGDPLHGGNAGQAGWRLVGYPGPRRVWSERDQALDGTDAR